jgi:hypothetical protein
MAQDFPILFTGKDVSYEPRTSGELEKAGQRFDERILQGEQYKREDRLRDQKFFFETADVDPVQLMSDRLTEVQEQTLNDFNDKWASVYSKQGGTLTSAQKSEMFRDRKAMESKQQQWLASQSRYERDYEMIKRDSMRASPMLDMDAFRGASEQYHTTGYYDGGLQYTPLNPGVYFTNNRLPGTGDRVLTSDIVGGRETTTETRVPGTKAESDDFIRSHIEQDMASGRGRLLMGIVKDFQDQPEEVKVKYLGGSFDGVVDTPGEQNAIINWAQDHYEKYTRRTQESQKDEELRPRVGSGSDKPTPYELIEGVIYDRIGNEIMRQSDAVSTSVISVGPGYEISDKVRTMNVDPKILFGSGKKGFAEAFGGLPKTKVRVRPEVMTSGEVEFLLAAPVEVERKVAEGELTRDIIRKAKVKNGEYYITESIPAGTPVGAYIKDVETDLANMLGGNSLKNAIEGLDPYAKYKE